MKNIIWMVQIKNVPAVDRYCKRCGAKTEFVSSGLFRINAQQKSLDVWLIYKCSVCDTTWNLTILSRVNPRSIPPETLQGFHENDSALAMRYATDTALIKRNGGEVGSPEIEVAGEDVNLSIPVCIHLIPEYPTEIKAASVLRGKLNLSRNDFDMLCRNGTLRCISGHDIKKCKLSGEIIIEIK